MIILEEKQTVFVHIPKCGGTTVRKRLSPFAERANFFNKIKKLPDGEEAEFSHLTLEQLAEHFPEALEKVRAWRSYAVVRDPMERFRSGLAEWQRTVGKVDPATRSKRELRCDLDEILSLLMRSDEGYDLPPRLVYFRRQSDWIDLEGKRLVDRIYPIGKVQALLSTIAEQTGLDLHISGRENQTLEMRVPGSYRALRQANLTVRRMLPFRQYSLIKSAVQPFLTRRVSKGVAALPFTAAEKAYLEEFYTADQALYRAVSRQHGD